MCHQSPKHYIEIWHERPFSLQKVPSSSPDVSNQFKVSQGKINQESNFVVCLFMSFFLLVKSVFCCFNTGCSQGKKRSVPVYLPDVPGDNVATRSHSQRNSLSPNVSLSEVGIIDNPEAIIIKHRVQRLAIRNQKSPLG